MLFTKKLKKFIFIILCSLLVLLSFSLKNKNINSINTVDNSKKDVNDIVDKSTKYMNYRSFQISRNNSVASSTSGTMWIYKHLVNDDDPNFGGMFSYLCFTNWHVALAQNYLDDDPTKAYTVTWNDVTRSDGFSGSISLDHNHFKYILPANYTYNKQNIYGVDLIFAKINFDNTDYAALSFWSHLREDINGYADLHGDFTCTFANVDTLNKDSELYIGGYPHKNIIGLDLSTPNQFTYNTDPFRINSEKKYNSGIQYNFNNKYIPKRTNNIDNEGKIHSMGDKIWSEKIIDDQNPLYKFGPGSSGSIVITKSKTVDDDFDVVGINWGVASFGKNFNDGPFQISAEAIITKNYNLVDDSLGNKWHTIHYVGIDYTWLYIICGISIVIFISSTTMLIIYHIKVKKQKK